MTKRILLLSMLALLAAGCANQDIKEQSKATVEQRDLLEAQRKKEDEARRAAAQREQDELNRRLAEEEARKRREMETAEVKPLLAGGETARPLTDAATMLRDPSSPLSRRSVYYDFDSFDIRGEYRDLVEAHAKFLMDNPKYRVRVEGNCDERGSTEYNLALGQRRAESVKRAMTLLGVPASRVEAVSYGEEKPKALGKDEEAYAENRRSDLIYPDVDK
jgi:peptidoglycan-associated lipoprotein